MVGDCKRFDLAAVLATLEEHKVATKKKAEPGGADSHIPGVRLLSRRKTVTSESR